MTPNQPQGHMPTSTLAAGAIASLQANLRCDSQAETLIIVRQSGPQAIVLLSKMLGRTLASHTHIPGWARIKANGIKPLFDREQYDTYWDLPAGGPGRATLYQVDGTFVLLVLGSAASRNVALSDAEDPTENAVVELYKYVLAALRPKQVLVGPFDRLVRAQRYAFPTFETFKSNVGRLVCEEDTIKFQAKDAQRRWFALVDGATEAHERLLHRTAAGSAEMARSNLWPLAGCQAPIGFTRDRLGEFVPVPEEIKLLEAVINMRARDGLTKAEAARRLVAEDLLPPKRRGEEGMKVVRGVAVPTGTQSADTRAVAWVKRVHEQVVDLAFNKFVSRWRQTASVEDVHLGARRNYISDSDYEHCFVWDLPDILGSVEEDVLLRFVRMAAETRLRRGLPASDWLVEESARNQARQILDAGSGTLAHEEVERWAGVNGVLIDSMGGGEEHQRGGVIRGLLTELIDGPIQLTPPEPAARALRLFARYPSWRDEHGMEWTFHTGAHNYSLLRRSADPTMSPHLSLRRAWNYQGAHDGRLLVTFAIRAFHRALAYAAAEAVESGVPVLRGQRTAAGVMPEVAETIRTARSVAILNLENSLTRARRDAVAASTATERVRREIELQADTVTGLRGPGRSGLEARLGHFEDEERRAWDRFARSEGELFSAREEDNSDDRFENPGLDDLDVLLQTLAGLANTVSAEPRALRSLYSFLPRLEFPHVDAFSVTFSFDLLLPGPAGKAPVLVGPITGTIPTVAQPRRHRSWGHAHAEARLTNLDSQFVDLSPKERHGRTVKTGSTDLIDTGARDYLRKDRGLTFSAATSIIASPVPVARVIVWNSLHGLETDLDGLGVDASYAARVREVYSPGRQAKRCKGARRMRERQAALTAVVEHGPLYTYEIVERLRQVVTRNLTRAEESSRLSLEMRRPGNEWVPYLSFERMPAPHANGMANLWSALQCPTCAENGSVHWVDTLAWEPEVPGGLLCSNCRRSPVDPGPLFPADYLDLYGARDRATLVDDVAV